ncbi:hypothetical protein ACROYT_G026207 [Oculina patagonica]
MKILVVLSFVVLMLAIVACTKTEGQKEGRGKGETGMGASSKQNRRSSGYGECTEAQNKRMHNCNGNGECQSHRLTGVLRCKCRRGIGGRYCDRLID